MFDAEGQALLDIEHRPPCATCCWRERGRCSGPRTVQSRVRRHGRLLSCFDTRKTALLVRNLREILPAPALAPQICPSLPAAIPILAEGMPEELSLDRDRLYGIAMADIVSARGVLKFDSGQHLRKSFRLPANGRICLIASASELRKRRVARTPAPSHPAFCLWDHRRRHGLGCRVDTITALGPRGSGLFPELEVENVLPSLRGTCPRP